MPDRACKATNKAGEPCKAAPLKDSEHCGAHDPNAPAETRFGSSQQASVAAAASAEVRRVVSAAQLAREWVEANHDRLVRVLDEAIEADKGVVVGNGPSASVEILPDHPTRLAAFREVLDRGYGKSTQAVEHSGPEGGPIQTEQHEVLSRLSPEKLRALRDILDEAGD